MGQQWMKEEHYPTYEDLSLSIALWDVIERKRHDRPDSNEWRYMRQVIADHDAADEVWGFKHPLLIEIIDPFLALVRNPHIVAILRDPLTCWQSERAYNGRGTWEEAKSITQRMFDILGKPRGPTLAVSYERGKVAAGEVRKAIQEFLQL